MSLALRVLGGDISLELLAGFNELCEQAFVEFIDFVKDGRISGADVGSRGQQIECALAVVNQREGIIKATAIKQSDSFFCNTEDAPGEMARF